MSEWVSESCFSVDSYSLLSLLLIHGSEVHWVCPELVFALPDGCSE